MQSSIETWDVGRYGLSLPALLTCVNVQQFVFSARPETCQGLWAAVWGTVFSLFVGAVQDDEGPLTCRESRQKYKCQQSLLCCAQYPLSSYIVFTCVPFIACSSVCDIQNIYSSVLDTYSRYQSYDYFILCSFIYVEIQQQTSL